MNEHNSDPLLTSPVDISKIKTLQTDEHVNAEVKVNQVDKHALLSINQVDEDFLSENLEDEISDISNYIEDIKDINTEEFIEKIETIFPMTDNDDKNISMETEKFIEEIETVFPTTDNDDENVTLEESILPAIDDDDNSDLSDEERMLLYDKAMHFKRLGSLNHALLCFLGCLQGLKPSSQSKFTMLPQCLTHISEIYATFQDYQRAVEFMQAAKLYYEIAIIETDIQVDEYKKESNSGYRPIDLDPCLDEAKRANEYEKLSYSCLEHKKFQLALDYCGKATKLRQEVYGNEHPVTSKSLELFTIIYAEMGKSQYSEAMEKYGNLNKVMEEKKEETNKEPAEEGGITATSIPTVESEPSQENTEDRTENNEHTPGEEIEEETVTTDETTAAKKNVTFEIPDGEKPAKLITPLQLFIIFLISAISSIVLTATWCYISESDKCPSRRYMYNVLRQWYYYYLVPPATGASFY